MIVAVELDANPPRLRRADGLVVQFPPNAEGGFPLIEVGWLPDRGSFDRLLRWRGFTYQELHAAAVKEQSGRDVFLVGHIPGGGYCSAVVGLDDTGMSMDFADRPPVGNDGLQRIEVEETYRRKWDLKRVPMCEGTTFELLEKQRNPDGTVFERFVISRKSAAAAIQHYHGLRSMMARG